MVGGAVILNAQLKPLKVSWIGVCKKWLPLVDLFRNCRLEIQAGLSELRRLFEVFGLAPSGEVKSHLIEYTLIYLRLKYCEK